MTPILLAITPAGAPTGDRSVDRWISAGADPATTAVLIRDPKRSARDLWLDRDDRFTDLRGACAESGIAMILSCHAAEVPALVGLPHFDELRGLQLKADPGQDALAYAQNALAGRGSVTQLLGRSCHGLRPPGGDGRVDYTVVAPVFTPRSEPAKPALGIAGLRMWASQPDAYVIALGGVSAETAVACVAAGARGLASITSFFGDAGRVHEDVAALAQSVRRFADGSPTSP